MTSRRYGTTGATRRTDQRLRQGVTARRRVDTEHQRLAGFALLVAALGIVTWLLLVLPGGILAPKAPSPRRVPGLGGGSASGGAGSIASAARTPLNPSPSSPGQTGSGQGSAAPPSSASTSGAPSASAPASAGPTGSPSGAGQANPVATVVTFYGLVARHHFTEAAQLWSPSLQQAYPPAQDIDARFADTVGIAYRLGPVTIGGSSATVRIDLVETRTVSPTRRDLVGSWDLVKLDGRWYMNAPHF